MRKIFMICLTVLLLLCVIDYAKGDETNRNDLIESVVCESNLYLAEQEVELLVDNNLQKSNYIEMQDEEIKHQKVVIKKKDSQMFWYKWGLVGTVTYIIVRGFIDLFK